MTQVPRKTTEDDAIRYAATCGTCAWRDEQGVCRERRSAWLDWEVRPARRSCYFYSRRPRLPRIGGGLEEPPEEQSRG